MFHCCYFVIGHYLMIPNLLTFCWRLLDCEKNLIFQYLTFKLPSSFLPRKLVVETFSTFHFLLWCFLMIWPANADGMFPYYYELFSANLRIISSKANRHSYKQQQQHLIGTKTVFFRRKNDYLRINAFSFEGNDFFSRNRCFTWKKILRTVSANDYGKRSANAVCYKRKGDLLEIDINCKFLAIKRKRIFF